MKTGYCIKTIKYKLRCSHPEWLTETEKYYRQVLDFYFRLLLEHEEIWELNVLQMGAGVNLDRYELAEYPLGQNIRFLFMGRVMKEKGINELFEAMHRLYSDGINCSLDILGGYEEDYKDIIQHYEKEGWLHYHGFQADVRPFIANCHCFVLPSWHEGMANTNLESAASGRPVITSNIHGCLEAVEDSVTGFLVERKNANDLYRIMKHFVGMSYEDRKNMGLAGRRRMEEIFDKNKVVEMTTQKLLGDL